ncbi:MAG: mechanosensitive ion channel family protein [Pseudomonadota bacterium]
MTVMSQMVSRVLCALGVSVLLLFATGHASHKANAQTANSERIPVTERELAKISDAELRALVLKRLAGSEQNTGGTFNPAHTAFALQAALEKARARLGTILATYTELPSAFASAWDALTKDRANDGFLTFLMLFGLSIAAGVIAEVLTRRSFAVPQREDSHADMSLSRKLGAFAQTLGGRGRDLFVFTAIATVTYLVVAGPDQRDRVTFAFYLAAIVVIRFVTGLLSSYFAVDRPERRIPNVSTSEARAIMISFSFAVTLGAFGFFTCALFATLGVHGDVHFLLLMIVGSVLTTGLAASFILNRGALSADLLLTPTSQGTSRSVRSRLAPAYPWLLAIGTTLLWISVVMSGLLGMNPLFGAGLITVAIGLLWPSLDAALEREVQRCQSDGDPVTPAVARAVRLLAAVAVLAILLIVWRVNVTGAAGSVGIGAAIAKALFEAGVVTLLSYAAWQALTIWIDRRIAEEKANAGDQLDITEMEIGGTGLSRMATLLPLFKRTGQATIAIIAFMLVLSAFGVSIGPVLAGAGVVGLAIGFGSQTLVRDIVSGAFFLIDDAFRLGEYIDLGKVKGSVEKISIRSLQLRHHRGALNTIPFGEISTVTNYSRDWVIMKLQFRVPFNTDIEKVRKLLKKVGQQLLEVEDIADGFLQPLKSQGVIDVDDYGLILRMKFMSKPGRQFVIRRYAYAAVQKAFAENGIQFSRPEVKVAVDPVGTGGPDAEHDDAVGPPPSASAAGAAAISAAKTRQAGQTPEEVT